MKTYKWTEQQKKALRGSIRKWVNIDNGSGANEGASNCPCCIAFIKNRGPKKSCKGCPIYEFTGKMNCYGTPYYSNDAETELNFLRAVYLAGGGK